jgi:putative tricarboxylic transport membrane protein
MNKLSNPIDVLSGLFLIGTALIFLWLGRHLPVGTVGTMGAGYVPRLLCWIQVALGAAVLLNGFTRPGSPLESTNLRALVLVLAAVTFFGMSVERLGLPLAVIGVVIIAGLAQRGARHLQSVVLAVVLAAFSVVIFIQGLGLQLSLWPTALGQ